MPLRHPAVIETLVLDHVPIVVRLGVLLSLGASQKHDAANLPAPRRRHKFARKHSSVRRHYMGLHDEEESHFNSGHE